MLVGTILVLICLVSCFVALGSSGIGLRCSNSWIFREVEHLDSCWVVIPCCFSLGISGFSTFQP